MAVVIDKKMPSPWEKFPEAMQAIVAPIRQIVEDRLWNQDSKVLEQLKPKSIMGSGGPLTAPGKSPQELLPLMRSERGRAMVTQMILNPQEKTQTTIFSTQGQPLATVQGHAQFLPQKSPTVVSPGSTVITPEGQTFQAPMSPYQQKQADTAQQKLALEERKVRVAEMNAQNDANYKQFLMSKESGPNGKIRQLMDLASIFGIKPTRENLSALNKQFLQTDKDFERFALNQAVQLTKENLDWSTLTPEQKAQRLMENKNLIINNYVGEGGMPGTAAAGQPQGWTPSQGPKPTKQGYMPNWW